jgi:uncharacterized RDD family membrane protein YckC
MDYTATNYPGTAATVSYANWLQRVGAYLIDNIIASVPTLIGLPFYVGSMDANGRPSGAGLTVYLLLSLVSLGIQIYNRYILAGRTGQSWGRRALRIRLVSERTGQPIGAGMAFLRDICHIVDAIICYIGFLFPLWDAKRQTLADKIMKTIVVNA